MFVCAFKDSALCSPYDEKEQYQCANEINSGGMMILGGKKGAIQGGDSREILSPISAPNVPQSESWMRVVADAVPDMSVGGRNSPSVLALFLAETSGQDFTPSLSAPTKAHARRQQGFW